MAHRHLLATLLVEEGLPHRESAGGLRAAAALLLLLLLAGLLGWWEAPGSGADPPWRSAWVAPIPSGRPVAATWRSRRPFLQHGDQIQQRCQASLRSLADSPCKQHNSQALVLSSLSSPGASDTTPQTGAPSQSTSGAHPNLLWRQVPMEDLRRHPLFQPLPPPDHVFARSLRDAQQFRQGTWQWDSLHDGRLTTRGLAATLGLFERTAAEVLKVPVSVVGQQKAVAAWQHLSRGQPVDPESLNANFSADTVPPLDPAAAAAAASTLWPAEAAGATFPYAYRPASSAPSPPSVVPLTHSLASRVWGSTQEATALLAAVNHFSPQGALVFESGMWAADGAAGLPPLGASPDAIVRWPNGTVAALEVKSVSPFWQRRPNSHFVLSDRGPPARIAPWHVPQLMLEICALGPDCTHAYLLSCSATKGVGLHRVARDDAYIAAMLRLVGLFHERFVLGQRPPPADFFAAEDGYRDFLAATARIAREAPQVALLRDAEVQRSPANRAFFL
eukprot:EG_transcript_8637